MTPSNSSSSSSRRRNRASLDARKLAKYSFRSPPRHVASVGGAATALCFAEKLDDRKRARTNQRLRTQTYTASRERARAFVRRGSCGSSFSALAHSLAPDLTVSVFSHQRFCARAVGKKGGRTSTKEKRNTETPQQRFRGSISRLREVFWKLITEPSRSLEEEVLRWRDASASEDLKPFASRSSQAGPRQGHLLLEEAAAHPAGELIVFSCL